MGIDIALRTEAGKDLERILDRENFLHNLLPQPYTDSDSMLGWINWYGDTMFNHCQIKRFLEEWDALAERAQTPEEKEFLAAVRALAVRCQKEETSYLWFIGD